MCSRFGNKPPHQDFGTQKAVSTTREIVSGLGKQRLLEGAVAAWQA